MVQRAIDIVAAALTTVLLAFGLFGSGLVVCMMPQTTQLLGNNFSGWNEATYPQDTMSELAEAVRSFLFVVVVGVNGDLQDARPRDHVFGMAPYPS